MNEVRCPSRGAKAEPRYRGVLTDVALTTAVVAIHREDVSGNIPYGV